MNEHTGLNQKQTVRIFFVLLFFTLLSINSKISAQNQKRKFVSDLKTDFGLTSTYDDNILKYSGKYIDRFLNHEDEGRFQIKTYDDVIWSPELEISATFHFFRKLNTMLDAGYRFTSYINNNNKNRNYFYGGIRQYITKKASIRFSYNYTPDFYIRHFRDEDWVEVYGYTPETFKPFSFSKDNYGVELQHTILKKTRIRLTYDYAKYYYNSFFTEYDCNNNSFGINLRQPIIKNLRIEGGYTYTVSKAKGYDESGESKQLSDDSDGSYTEDEFLLRIMWNLPDLKKHNHSIEAKGEYGKRYFTSEKNTLLDPLHAGRVDDNLLLSAAYSLEITKAFGISLFYNYYSRNATSVAEENRQYISEEKDYNQNQIGIKLSYGLKF